VTDERLGELAQDAGLTLFLLIVGIAGTHPASQDQLDWSRTPDGWAYLLVVLAALPFVLRRRHPIAVAVASGTAVLTYLAVGYAFGPIMFTIPVASYTLGSLLPMRSAVRWVAGYYLLMFAVSLSRMIREYGDDLWRQVAGWTLVSLAAFGAPLAIGVAVRVRRDSQAGVRAALARLSTRASILGSLSRSTPTVRSARWVSRAMSDATAVRNASWLHRSIRSALPRASSSRESTSSPTSSVSLLANAARASPVRTQPWSRTLRKGPSILNFSFLEVGASS
jgi:hypothetical protein